MGTSGDPSPAYVLPPVSIEGRIAGGRGVRVTFGPGGDARWRAPGPEVAVPAVPALPSADSKGPPVKGGRPSATRCSFMRRQNEFDILAMEVKQRPAAEGESEGE